MASLTSGAPDDPKTGILRNWPGASGLVWVCQFGPYQQRRSLDRIAIVPPGGITPGDQLSLFRETTMVSNSPAGNATNFVPVRLIGFPAGTSLFLVWFYNGGSAPEATMFSETELI